MTVTIIGGGAAGMMAVVAIKENNPDVKVILIEKNSLLGRKVLISGGGRCNLTTGVQDVRQVLTKYARGEKFLTSAMYNFPPADVYEWFEDKGVPLKIEDDMRVFPQSNQGQDVVGVFEQIFQEHGVEVILRNAVASVQKKDDKFFIKLGSGKEIYSDKLILTTGGEAYRHTGSTGDGYKFAETLGHTITSLAASLNSFNIQEDWIKELSGVSFENVSLQVLNTKYSARGPIVCTHNGISGPAVFALSSQVAFEDYKKDNPLLIEVDFVPHISKQELVKSINQILLLNPKQQIQKTLHSWLPKSMVKQQLNNLQIPEDQANASVSKQDRIRIVDWMKSCSLSVIGRGSGSEFVTAGGVDTAEVNPSTMESKICPGLYFAGEILNIDGITGGFNLQSAWATGRLAGESVVSI
ncbi:MAG: NAD(P)/FAD-dependent oxidoreductase [bacterium]|nr:NAD(P)/FAD-dependent oxidoreductase [bacterium]